MLLPSVDQIGTLPPPARGAPLSPKTLAPTSQSNDSGHIARLRVFDQIHHPEIGLSIRIDRIGRGRDKRDLFAVRAEGEPADIHVDRR